jgi:predicted ester cyclase
MRQKRLLFCIGVAAIVYSGGFQSMFAMTPVRAAETNGEQLKTLVRRSIEQGFNRRDLSVVDELFASEVIVNSQRVSRAAVKQSMNRFITALHATITDIVAAGDKVAIWYSVQGRQTGDFEGIRATRKQALVWRGSLSDREGQNRRVPIR